MGPEYAKFFEDQVGVRDVLGELVWMARCIRSKAAEAEVSPGEYEWQTGQPVADRSGYVHRSDPEMPGEVSGRSLLP